MGLLKRVTRRVSHVEQELHTVLKHLSSNPCFHGSSCFSIVSVLYFIDILFARCLILLSLHCFWVATSDYPCDIKLFLAKLLVMWKFVFCCHLSLSKCARVCLHGWAGHFDNLSNFMYFQLLIKRIWKSLRFLLLGTSITFSLFLLICYVFFSIMLVI